MKGLVIEPGKRGVRLVTVPEPSAEGPRGIKLRVLEVGICGTDREEAGGGRALAPPGKNVLVLGHELLGEVVDAGAGVTSVKQGDLAVFTVRRGCGECLPCGMNRSDMCRTGRYSERGIWGLDGFQTEFVTDEEEYVVGLPPQLRDVGVLCEPLSIVEKALHEGLRIQQARLPDAGATPRWLYGRRCLVAGLGPVGLLAALALRLRGAEVYGLDIVEPDSPRAQILREMGGSYVDGREVPADKVDDRIGPMELIFEAAGIPLLAFNLLDALSPGSIYLVTGIPGGTSSISIPGADLMRELVLDNRLMLGSVNASRDHFLMAADDLFQGLLQWPGLLQRLITHRYSPEEGPKALLDHSADEVKGVVRWG
jgi:glucose 1-dehydrogenase